MESMVQLRAALAAGLLVACAGHAAGESELEGGALTHSERSEPSVEGASRLRCPAQAVSPQPVQPITAQYDELWRWPRPTAAPSQLFVDDSALYWIDTSGSIWRLGKGDPEAVELRPLPGDDWTFAGFVGDGDDLFWGESALLEGNWAPPSRLMRMPKAGGAATVVIESPDHVLGAVGTDAERLFVNLDMSEGPPLWQVDRSTHMLTELPASPPAGMSRFASGSFYWVAGGSGTGTGAGTLMRATAPTLEHERIGPIAGSIFDVSPAHVLWRQGVVTDERLPVLGENFVAMNLAGDCVHVLPGIGETISFGAAVDATHVYWQRHTPGFSFPADHPPPALPIKPLYRTSLQTGVTERLETPGLRLEFGSWIAAQDAAHVYVAADTALIAIAKP